VSFLRWALGACSRIFSEFAVDPQHSTLNFSSAAICGRADSLCAHFCLSFLNRETKEHIGSGHIFDCEPAAPRYCHEGPICIMSGFFEELQRRKVYRVAAAYIVAAGFLIQMASATFPAWELPNWSLRLVIALLLIGFPIALLLAWAYDITPQGIQSTPKTPGAHCRRNLILLIVTGVIVSASAGFFLLPRAVWHKVDKSVAVLPFQNLSSDPENAYIA
jgi:hypothetical protein